MCSSQSVLILPEVWAAPFAGRSRAPGASSSPIVASQLCLRPFFPPACLWLQAILNFDLSHYQDILDDPDSYDPLAACGAGSEEPPAGGGSSGSLGGSIGGGGGGGTRAASKQPSVLAPTPVRLAPPAASSGSAGFPMSLGGTAAGLMAGCSGYGGSSDLFLPLMQAMQLPLGMQQQFVMNLALENPWLQQQQYTAQAPQATAPAAAMPPPRLPAIRTRNAAASLAATAAANAAGAGFSGSSTPASAASGGSFDLSGILSPLAASLLSPLGLSGTPRGEQAVPLILQHWRSR